MKKRNLLLVILAVLLVFGLVMSCDPDGTGTTGGGGGGGNTTVSFSGVAADGPTTQAKMKVKLTFGSPGITGLAIGDITLGGVASVEKDALTGSGTTWTLTIKNYSAGGTLTVNVSKTGYTINGNGKTLAIKSAADAAVPYFTGEYIGSYKLKSGKIVNETITFNKTSLNISDDEKTIKDYLTFTIQEWAYADTPTLAKDDDNPNAVTNSPFLVGFKLTGLIDAAKPDTPVLYGTKTANDFVKADLKTTKCTLYLYIQDNGTSDYNYLLRSVISKASGTTATIVDADGNTQTVDANMPVTGSDQETSIRIFRDKNSG